MKMRYWSIKKASSDLKKGVGRVRRCMKVKKLLLCTLYPSKSRANRNFWYILFCVNYINASFCRIFLSLGSDSFTPLPLIFHLPPKVGPVEVLCGVKYLHNAKKIHCFCRITDKNFLRKKDTAGGTREIFGFPPAVP